MEQVKVVIPVYRPELTAAERASLRQTVQVLGCYPLVLLHPEDVDVTTTLREFPALKPLAVSGQWLGRRNGIAGYNRMMLSADFYDLFSDTEYILICHTDAWIFRDELAAWCAKGYDCVAAPWVRRPVYNLPVVRHVLALRRWWSRRSGKPIRQLLYGRIGNGGLSLRRVAAFREACVAYSQSAQQFLACSHHLYNEDVFWATVPRDFHYPTWQQALGFAFDTNPAYCYKLCGGQLPFGCHSWSKKRYRKFWTPIIGSGAV